MEKKLLYGTLFLFKFKMPPLLPPKKHNYVSRIQVPIETVSLPEQVKQKENLCDQNIQLKNLSWHLRSFCNFLLLTLDLCLSTVHIHVLSGRACYTTCDVINLNVNRYSR